MAGERRQNSAQDVSISVLFCRCHPRDFSAIAAQLVSSEL